MSLRPFLRSFWDDPWFGMSEPSRMTNQHFGQVVPDELFMPPQGMMMGYPRQMPMPMQRSGGASEVVNNEQEFRASLDVQHFKPEEINIKTKDNRIIINAKHEERPDEHGFIMREFTRQIVLPKDVDPNTVTSSLSREGMLTIRAPKKSLEAPTERNIPITHEPSQ